MRKCDLDLAPGRALAVLTIARRTSAVSPTAHWTHGSLITPPTPDEPSSVADGTAASILGEAEDRVMEIGDRVRAEVDAERAAARGKRRWWSRFFSTYGD